MGLVRDRRRTDGSHEHQNDSVAAARTQSTRRWRAADQVLRELEKLRFDPVVLRDVKITDLTRAVLAHRSPVGRKIADLTSDAMEIRITISRDQAARKLFGFTLFSDGKGVDCRSCSDLKTVRCAWARPKHRSRSRASRR